MTEYKLVPVKRCAACRNEKPVSEMQTCMHHQMHRYVCDSKCMNDFYNPPKNPRPDSVAPAVQGEPVELSADMARLYDVIGLRRSQPVSTLIANIENIKRFSGYLWAVEREFFMVPGEPDEDYPDEYPEPACLLSCFPAESTAAYVEQFRKALKGVTAQQPAEQKPANPDDTATAILGDRMYIAGLKAGWNYAEAGDRAGFDLSIENGHREIREAKQELAEQQPVAEVKYGGYASGNELVWAKGAGLQFLPEGTKLYAASIHAPTPVAYLDVGAGGYMDLGTDLTEDHVGSLPWGRHILAIVGTYGAEGYVPAEQQPAPDVARLVGALELVGEDAESDVAGLVEALQGALNGRPLDTEFWDRCEQFISAHRKQQEGEA